MIIDSDDLTPGQILDILLQQYEICYDDVVKESHISVDIFVDIIYRGKLIPYAIAIVVNNMTNIPLEFFAKINDNYIKKNSESTLEVIGKEYGYVSLFNKIVFEKDDEYI